CSAVVTANGKPITKADVRKGREPMLVAGDTIHAQFQFPRQVHCSWHSAKVEGGWNVPPPVERWGFHIFGTKRILAYYSGSQPLYYYSAFLEHITVSSEWKPRPGNPPHRPAHQKQLAKGLIHAIENGAERLCSAEDGRWTIQMPASVYESQRLGA